MNEIAYERAMVALTLQGWREMLANQYTRGRIIKAMCPGLTVSGNLAQYVIALLTTEDPLIDEQSNAGLAATEAALSA